MQALIALSADGLTAVQQQTETNDGIPLADVTLQTPLLPRRNIMCLGLNYAEHVHESLGALGQEISLPQLPIVFTKATTAVTGPTSPIPFDPNVSEKIDWEVELGVIIGKQGKNIAPEQAMDYVYGYTVLNDISARDLQRQGKQYFKGKSLDGSCPMGPWIVTAAAISSPHNLNIRCLVNGIEKQVSNTRHMIFDIPATIAYLSRGMTLLPGDIIATGTPDGVGFARTPPQFLRPGDVVTSFVEGIGELRNVVTAV
ncbi:MAG: fumarylacetoacetate hydrolase family protein [Chloroflexi bacterium]|nr:fumarylacetoacetate hydrolase family protein [Chloroflexota bacterium]